MHAPSGHNAAAGHRRRTPARWGAAAITAAAALTLVAGAAPASAAGGYAVTATITLPAGSSWPDGVAVDLATHTRLRGQRRR
jgi:hypothetical protein